MNNPDRFNAEAAPKQQERICTAYDVLRAFSSGSATISGNPPALSAREREIAEEEATLP